MIEDRNLIADLEAALKMEPGNATVEDELARLVWAEKKAEVYAYIYLD